jgi:APA family basic amino acid/polyamine antiporter
VTGLITVAAALSYGELAGMIKAGGQFVYIQRAYGRLVFFIWLDCFTVIQTGVIAAIAGLQTILRYSFGIRYYTFRLGDSFVFLLVNCWLSQVLLYSRSSILKGLKAEINSILTSAKLIALLHLLIVLYVGFHTDVLSNNFNNMWEASRTVLNGDGSITVKS